MNAEWLDASVLVTVRARQSGVAFSDSRLGAALYGYRDGEWRELGDAGPNLPAERILRDEEIVRIRVEVDGDAALYRAAVRVVDDDRLSLAWVTMPPR